SLAYVAQQSEGRLIRVEVERVGRSRNPVAGVESFEEVIKRHGDLIRYYLSERSGSGDQPRAITSAAGANGAGTLTLLREPAMKSLTSPLSESSSGMRTINAGPSSGLWPMETTSIPSGAG